MWNSRAKSKVVTGVGVRICIRGMIGDDGVCRMVGVPEVSGIFIPDLKERFDGLSDHVRKRYSDSTINPEYYGVILLYGERTS